MSQFVFEKIGKKMEERPDDDAILRLEATHSASQLLSASEPPGPQSDMVGGPPPSQSRRTTKEVC